jgi:hypothetical protein
MKFKWSYLVLATLVLLDLAFLFTVNFPAVEINPYLLRDVHRALYILKGHFVFVGPDFTSGSYAPGPFFYLTIMPVLAFMASPFAVVAYMMIVKVIAQLLFSTTFSSVMKVPASVIYLVMSSSAFLLERFIWVNNSSFIGPFVQILAVLSYLYWKSENERRRNWLLLVISLFVGGCFQTHFSLVFVVPAMILLILEKTKSDQKRRKDFLIFAAGIGVSIIPFAIAYVNDRFLHLFSGAIFFRSQLGVKYFAEDWWRIFGKQWKVFSEPDVFKVEVVVVFAYIILRAAWVLWKTRQGGKNFFDKVSIATALMTIAFTGWILSGSYMRYFTVLFVFALAYMTYDAYHLALKGLRNKVWVFVLFLIATSFMRNEFYFFPKNLGLQGKCEDCIRQMTVMCDYFNDKKISFEQFSKSAYELFPTNSHGSLFYLRHCFDKQTGTEPSVHTRYLFADSDFLTSDQVLSQTLEKIPAEVRPFYSDLRRFKKEIQMNGFTLFSVEQEQVLDLESRYTNLAYSYELDPAVGEKLVIQEQRREGYDLYKASFCDSPVFCDLYISAKRDAQNLQLHFSSRVFQTKTDLAPLNGTVKNLRIDYLCDGKKVSLAIASSLGVSLETHQNEVLFTPLDLKKSIDCKEVSLQSVSLDHLELSSNTDYHAVDNESFPLQKL